MAVCEAMQCTDMRVCVCERVCVMCVHEKGGGKGLVGGQEKNFHS